MNADINKMEERIDKYFKNISDEQLKKDVQSAGYSYYIKIKNKIFSQTFYSSKEMATTKVKRDPTKTKKVTVDNFVKYSYPDSYLIEFQLAA